MKTCYAHDLCPSDIDGNPQEKYVSDVRRYASSHPTDAQQTQQPAMPQKPIGRDKFIEDSQNAWKSGTGYEVPTLDIDDCGCGGDELDERDSLIGRDAFIHSMQNAWKNS
jgi:hypothetical protein